MDKIYLLIEKLTKELKPVKTKSWEQPCFVWCSLFVLFLIGSYILSIMVGIRQKSIFELLSTTFFLFGVLTFLSSFLYVIFLSLPGRNYQIWRKITYFIFSLWSVIILLNVFKNSDLNFQFDEVLICGIGTIFLSLLLVVFIISFVKKRFVLDWDSVIVGSILTSLISSTLCLGFMCQNDTEVHTFLGHYLPVVFLLLIVRLGIFIKNKYF